MFYNLENLFDYNDDLENDDSEFLPSSERNWNAKRYFDKLNKLRQCIKAAGSWSANDIIGLCEIENKTVVQQLFAKELFKPHSYKIIHQESPDHRGIDLALVYNSETVRLIDAEFLGLIYPGRKTSSTREIIYAKLSNRYNDTLHVFVNHWPSRWGGTKSSEFKRIAAAKLLKSKIDSIQNYNKEAQIVVMGDFNDYPEDISLRKVLGAKLNFNNIEASSLYNISYHMFSKTNIGSYKYKGKWGMLDQFIVSGSMLLKNTRLVLDLNSSAIVYNKSFLLEDDPNYSGVKPFRTYKGMKYNGGFSDHLPILLLFKKIKRKKN
jgi:predicted extracellular nuclease